MGNPLHELRPAIEADNDQIADVWHSSASLPGVGPPVMPALGELRERVDAELAAGWNVTVAVRDGRIAGFVAIRTGDAVLDQLFVRPDARGAGIGGALLAHAKTAMPNGFSLFTRAGNASARRFYEKAGLVPLREDLHPRVGDPIVYYGWKITLADLSPDAESWGEAACEACRRSLRVSRTGNEECASKERRHTSPTRI